jgi:hypothetical protein
MAQKEMGQYCPRRLHCRIIRARFAKRAAKDRFVDRPAGEDLPGMKTLIEEELIARDDRQTFSLRILQELRVDGGVTTSKAQDAPVIRSRGKGVPPYPTIPTGVQLITPEAPTAASAGSAVTVMSSV